MDDLNLDFFEPLVPADKFHKNFSSIIIKGRKAERDLFSSWAEGFVDRDNKIVKEFQTSFNSSFWEIYLYRVFVEFGCVIDWSKSSPDFSISSNGGEFVVEAVTAGAANGKPNEWDKNFSDEELESIKRFKVLNTEAIIRLSNAVLSKVRKYNESYNKLDHVKRKPFVIAVAPFEQPHFNLQYDRAIRALLYDCYVDEDVFLDEPGSYPEGPPTVQLGFVTKDNGSEVPLGFFNDSGMEEVSAVIFSCTATWGKLSAMCDSPEKITTVWSTWATYPNGVPEKRLLGPKEHAETVIDGLQVYHNPYARYPLDPSIFKGDRVVQHFYCEAENEWVYEGRTDALLTRGTFSYMKSENLKAQKNKG
ncbi:hypothetical protein ACF8PU_04115 [Pseudomonas sp. GLN_6]|uniref:hypothetical protein n=1 Tax=Pseudomonas sp. GLN_6 TaxID=3367183 RepID=UPI00370A62D6